ncbi:MAG: Spo0E family sporulation regulatory protein-aspartic acid phosphatase, partial [Clostridiaceae bacterium]
MKLEKKLKREKIRLNRMIEIYGGNLVSEAVLEQSRKVDKLIIAYEKTKNNAISMNKNVKYKAASGQYERNYGHISFSLM